jgi:hypothetical protein
MRMEKHDGMTLTQKTEELGEKPVFVIYLNDAFSVTQTIYRRAKG